jgi:hypothetical protein
VAGAIEATTAPSLVFLPGFLCPFFLKFSSRELLYALGFYPREVSPAFGVVQKILDVHVFLLKSARLVAILLSSLCTSYHYG